MLKAIVEDFGNGGTIDGDLVVSGDLQVSGGGSLSFDEIVSGTQVVEITNTEALLVRKASDGGDIFIVDTDSPLIKMGGNLTFTHDIATISSTTGLLQFRILETGQDMLFDAGGDFKFRDTDDSNATRVIIKSGTGLVGIGESSPDVQLHLKQSAGSQILMQRTAGSTDGTLGEISFGASDGDE